MARLLYDLETGSFRLGSLGPSRWRWLIVAVILLKGHTDAALRRINPQHRPSRDLDRKRGSGKPGAKANQLIAEVEIALRGHTRWLGMMDEKLVEHDLLFIIYGRELRILRAARVQEERRMRKLEQRVGEKRKPYRTCRRYHTRRNGKCVDVRLYPAFAD